MVQSLPTVVCPLTVTCEVSVQPVPITALAPITQ
jgi:hypothetical protein